jgi:small subunit ribosomal protein S24e
VEVRILEERANPLLKRHEYHFEVAHATAPTPSREEVRGELSKLVRAPKDRVVIERMGARYGTATTRGDALVYDSVESAKLITRSHILVRNKLKEKEVPAAPGAPAPERAAESPKAEPPKESAPPAEAKPESPSTAKHETKPEHKPEHKGEHKAEPKADHKAEHKSDEKAEGHKPEHKADHKGKGAKSEKEDAPAKE